MYIQGLSLSRVTSLPTFSVQDLTCVKTHESSISFCLRFERDNCTAAPVCRRLYLVSIRYITPLRLDTRYSLEFKSTPVLCTAGINIRAHFFTVRVIKVWNKLPPSIVVADSATSFVRGLNSLSSDFYCV